MTMAGKEEDAETDYHGKKSSVECLHSAFSSTGRSNLMAVEILLLPPSSALSSHAFSSLTNSK